MADSPCSRGHIHKGLVKRRKLLETQDFSFPIRKGCIILPPKSPEVLEDREEGGRGSYETKVRVVGVVESVPEKSATSKPAEVQAGRRKIIKLNGSKSKAVGEAEAEIVAVGNWPLF